MGPRRFCGTKSLLAVHGLGLQNLYSSVQFRPAPPVTFPSKSKSYGSFSASICALKNGRLAVVVRRMSGESPRPVRLPSDLSSSSVRPLGRSFSIYKVTGPGATGGRPSPATGDDRPHQFLPTYPIAKKQCRAAGRSSQFCALPLCGRRYA